MRINGKINWLRVLIPSAIIAALVLVTFRYDYVMNNSTVYRIDALTSRFCKYPCTPKPTQPPMPSPQPTATPISEAKYLANRPLKDQLANEAAQRMVGLEATVHMSDTNFGQAMSNSYFQTNSVIEQAFESSDGLLFVVSSTCAQIGAGCERYHFEIVSGDQLQEIWLPHKSGEWEQMNLQSSSYGRTAVVRAQTFGEQGPYGFEISGRSIVRVPAPDLSQIDSSPSRRLADGTTCALETKATSPTLIWRVKTGRPRTALVSKAQLLDATQSAIRPSDVADAYCSHFHDVDLLIALNDDARLIFVLAPGEFRFAGPGEPILETRNHMLLMQTDVDQSGSPIAWEYANMTPKVPFPQK